MKSRFMSGSTRSHCATTVAVLVAMVTLGKPTTTQAVTRHTPSRAELVLAGGCYWGVESVFEHVRGINSVTAGFALPRVDANVSHPPPSGIAEAVRIVYDPSRISYHQLLDVFFSVVQDPTQLNRQGPDVGARYRSMVFVNGKAERAAARAYIDSLTTTHAFPNPIVTLIAELKQFEAAPEPQQDYAEKHPMDAYIRTYDAPKIKSLEARFPSLFRE